MLDDTPPGLKFYLFTASVELHSYLSEVQVYIIKSCLARDDYQQARKLISDWQLGETVHISKFIPGDHYYVGKVKFDSYEQAADYIRSNGKTVGSVKYIHVYTER